MHKRTQNLHMVSGVETRRRIVQCTYMHQKEAEVEGGNLRERHEKDFVRVAVRVCYLHKVSEAEQDMVSKGEILVRINSIRTRHEQIDWPTAAAVLPVRVQTKSGSLAWHDTAWRYVRGSRLTARQETVKSRAHANRKADLL